MQTLCPTLEASGKLDPLLAVALHPFRQPRSLLLSPVCWRVCLGRRWTPAVGCEPVIRTRCWLPGVCSCSIPYTAFPITMGAVPLWTWEVEASQTSHVNPESCKRYYVTGVRGKLWSSAASLDKNLVLKPRGWILSNLPSPFHSAADARSLLICGPSFIDDLVWKHAVAWKQQ